MRKTVILRIVIYVALFNKKFGNIRKKWKNHISNNVK